MRVLVTGATSNVSRGMIPRLRAQGHDLVLHDVVRAPETETFAGLPYIQGDIQAGIGLERVVHGCELILHTPAWHGIHWREKTEADYWRLNVDGTFWMFQAAAAEGIRRVVFLSSMAWHGHYDKYGFTKVIGEELCEYYRRSHGIGFAAVRPHDFTPWGSDWANRYGARLLYGGVDREDVLDCVEASIRKLAEWAGEGQPPGIVVNALRANAFTEEQITDWEQDPLAACERAFPYSRALVEKYRIDVARKPNVVDLGQGATEIGYAPKRHFGTFLAELARVDAEGGPEAVAAITCPY